MWQLIRPVSERQVTQHNEATRCIIAGLIAEAESDLTANKIIELSAVIMRKINHRGYVPHILGCNILESGKCV